jgi:hypothetical protein
VAGKQQDWIKWYFSHWSADAGVRSVSLEARGLWIDMLALMDQAPRRGYLQQANGRQMTVEQLAILVGSSIVIVSRLLQELESAGVYSSDATGTIFSRRMVRDVEQRAREAARKSSSAHFPDILRSRGVRGDLSSLESLYSGITKEIPFRSQEFLKALMDWLEYKSGRGENYSRTAFAALLKKLGRWSEPRARSAIEHSIASTYQGIFEDRQQAKTLFDPDPYQSFLAKEEDDAET